MNALYDLKDKICRELETYSKKDLTAGTLTMIDTLAHAAKNLDKIIEGCETEGGYSSRGYYGRSYDDGYSRRYSGRDSMGRYSGHQKDAVDELKDLMRDVPDEGTRRKIQTILNHME